MLRVAETCEIFLTCVSAWFLHVYLKKYVISCRFRRKHINMIFIDEYNSLNFELQICLQIQLTTDYIAIDKMS